MNFELTQHAREVIDERRISMNWVETVLESPERVDPDREDPDIEHRLGRIREHGNRVLRVVVNHKTKPVRIVTAYFDRIMRDKL